MSSNWFFLLLALLAGAVMPTQAAVNSKLAAYVQSPVLSAFISFAVGTIALIIYILGSGVPVSHLISAKDAPPVAWTGGLLGAYFVVAVVSVVPRFGVALTFSVIIAGQMLLTLLLDHYGFLDIPVKAVNFPRILGIILIIAGVMLIRRF